MSAGRFCEKCQLHVHDLRSLSEAEATELLRGASGRVCGRVFQRADGTVLTKDCPVGEATLRHRLVMSVVTVAALVFAVVGLVSARGSRPRDEPASRVGNALRTRFNAAKGSLRSTSMFGPLLNRIDPCPGLSLGEVVEVSPPKTAR